MRIYHRACRRYSGGQWQYLTPDSISAVTYTLGGQAVESLAVSYDSDTNRYYVITTNGLYTSGMIYEIRWTVTINATPYVVSDYFMHQSAQAIGSPPESPQLYVKEIHAGYAIVGIIEPSDPDNDYSHTKVYVSGRDGSFNIYTAYPPQDVTAQGNAGVEYFAVGVAYDSEGNASEPSAIVTFVPLASEDDSVGNTPITVRWYADEEGEHPYSPAYIDPYKHGVQTIGSIIAPIARGRGLRIRVENTFPQAVKLRRIALMFVSPIAAPPEGVRRKAVVR